MRSQRRPTAAAASARDRSLPQSRAGTTYGAHEWPDQATTRTSKLSRRRIEQRKTGAFRCRAAEVGRAPEVSGARDRVPVDGDWASSVHIRWCGGGARNDSRALAGKRSSDAAHAVSAELPAELRRCPSTVVREQSTKLTGGTRRLGRSATADGGAVARVDRLDGGKAVNRSLTAVSKDSMFYVPSVADAPPERAGCAPRGKATKASGTRSASSAKKGQVKVQVRTTYAPQVLAHSAAWGNARRGGSLSYPLRNYVAWEKTAPGGHVPHDKRGDFRGAALLRWAGKRTQHERAGAREPNYPEFRDLGDIAPRW